MISPHDVPVQAEFALTALLRFRVYVAFLDGHVVAFELSNRQSPTYQAFLSASFQDVPI